MDWSLCKSQVLRLPPSLTSLELVHGYLKDGASAALPPILTSLSARMSWVNIKPLPGNITELSLMVTKAVPQQGFRFLPPSISTLKLMCHEVPLDINRIPSTVETLIIHYCIPKVSEIAQIPLNVTEVAFECAVDPRVLSHLSQRPKLRRVEIEYWKTAIVGELEKWMKVQMTAVDKEKKQQLGEAQKRAEEERCVGIRG